jgi:hypothetical protein
MNYSNSISSRHCYNQKEGPKNRAFSIQKFFKPYLEAIRSIKSAALLE